MVICTILAQRMVPSRITPQKKNIRGLRWATIIIFVLCVGLRYDVGSDYLYYEEVYNTYKRTGDFIIDSPDLFFIFVYYVLKILEAPAVCVFIVYAFILMYSVSYLASKYREFAGWFMFFFFCIIFPESNNVMRQICAFFICCIAHHLYINDKKKNAITVGLIACCVHESSIIAFPLIFFSRKDVFKNKYFTIMLLIASFMLGYVMYDYIKMFMLLSSSFAGGRLAKYLSEESIAHFEDLDNKAEGLSASLIYLCINIYLVKISDKLKAFYKGYHFTFHYNVFLVGQVINPMLIASTMLLRANYYLYLYQIITMAFLLHYLWNFEKKWYSRILCLTISFVFLFLYYRHIANNEHYYPWLFIFD